MSGCSNCSGSCGTHGHSEGDGEPVEGIYNPKKVKKLSKEDEAILYS